jgi:DNA-binding beta-propeller fold protein YncE
VTAAIRVSPSPGSVAVNPRTGTVFVTTYPSHKVVVISARKRTVTKTIGAGSGLGEIAVNPATNKVYVTDPLRNTVKVLASCRG